MKTPSRSLQNSGQEHDSHFKQILVGGCYEGNPLLPEYHLLHNEYCTLKHRIDAMAKEKNNLLTQMGEMNRSLDLATRIDPMTGLANRRDIMEKVEREGSRAERHLRTFSIMLADIDNFKLVNDMHGYNAGDDVLVEVARVLMGCIRSEDVCARWGGEEFLFLLTETNMDGALNVAQKIHSAVDMTEFKARKPGIHVTISIGICEYQLGQTIHDCITRADKALQQAKQRGKNCCVVA